jgi:hypothetical protein
MDSLGLCFFVKFYSSEWFSFDHRSAGLPAVGLYSILKFCGLFCDIYITYV